MSAADAATNLPACFPVSLRQVEGRWQVVCSDRPPILVARGAPTNTVETIIRALDQNKPLVYHPLQGDTQQIASIETKLPPELPPEIVSQAPKLRPEWTPQVWQSRIPLDKSKYDRDEILWLTHLPKNGFARITFVKKHSPHYLPDNLPDHDRVMTAIQKSIAEGKMVKVACYSYFVVDVRE